MKKFISTMTLFIFLFTSVFLNYSNIALAEVQKDRIYGSNRIETSIKISEKGWPSGADSAVIVEGYGYADALCAAPLAKKYNSPILLSNKNSLSESALQELKRLKVKKVFLVGGTGVLSTNIEKQLQSIDVKEHQRICGQNRYETSVKIAEALGAVQNIVVASGDGYADSLSIASIAAQKGMPILLCQKESLPSAVKNYIDSNKENIQKSYVIGGKAVVSDSLFSLLPSAERISGDNRFETNLAIIDKFQNELNFGSILITQGDGPTGGEFADALASAPLAAQNASPMVLTYKTIYGKTATFIASKVSDNTKLIALGGIAVVPEEILTGIIDLHNGKNPASGIETASSAVQSSTSTAPVAGDKSFTLKITRDHGAKTIQTRTMKLENKNAMEYLKSISKVTELQGPGFINGIDGLLNVFLKDLTVEQRKSGLLGIDWFIYLNGQLTPVGALGVYPKEGDTLTFDYHEWDWHALMDPGYKGNIPLKLENIPTTVKVGDQIKFRVTCVYRGIYNVKVKIDGSEVTTTDIDGYASITMKSLGKHTLTVEKDGGSSEKQIEVTDSTGGGTTSGGTTSDTDLIPSSITKANSTYGNSSKSLEVKKDIYISANNVTLQNISIDGNLTIDPGPTGVCNLQRLTVKKIYIKSGDVNSIHLEDVRADSIEINSNSKVRVETKGQTQIGDTQIESNCILEVQNGTFGQVQIKEGTALNPSKTVELKGNFKDKVSIQGNVELLADTKEFIPEVRINSSSQIAAQVKGKFSKVIVDGLSKIKVEDNTEISAIEANVNVDIETSGVAKIGVIEKGKDVKVGGNVDPTVIKDKEDQGGKPDTPSNPNNPDTPNTPSNPNTPNTPDTSKKFRLMVTRDHGSKVIKEMQLEASDSINAMQHLKGIAKVTELQGPGFINGIDGLLNVFLKDLTVEQRKQGFLGLDWFIYLNGKLTPVGALGVYPKAGDTLNFDYHEWDWHALMPTDYSGTIPLKLENVPSAVNAGDQIKLRVTCVYRGIYGVIVKVDGQQVATTDIDGYAQILISTAGQHTITVEKDGGSKSKTIQVKESTSPTPDPPVSKETKLIEILSPIHLSIVQSTNGTIKISGSCDNSNDSLAVILYDEKENTAYLNQSANGQMQYETILKPGKYHGYIRSTSIDKIEIKEFKVN